MVVSVKNVMDKISSVFPFLKYIYLIIYKKNLYWTFPSLSMFLPVIPLFFSSFNMHKKPIDITTLSRDDVTNHQQIYIFAQ